MALANQLRAELEAFWAGAALLFSEIDSSISLAFLERYPSPTDAARLAEKRLLGFLSKNRYCGGKSATRTAREAQEGTAREGFRGGDRGPQGSGVGARWDPQGAGGEDKASGG